MLATSKESSLRPYHAYAMAMVRPCHVKEDHYYAKNRFCWCLSPLHMKTGLPPIKFDVRNGDVVNLGEICNFHIHATLPLRCCQVLTSSYTFLLGSYYASITPALSPIKSYHVIAMPKKI